MASAREPKPPDERGPARPVIVGRVDGAFGVQGWVRVRSFTEVPAAILDYGPWELRRGDWRSGVTPVEGREHAGGVVVRLAECPDREHASALRGAEVLVPRAALPELPAGQYYWTDLEGLEVLDADGRTLGRVSRVMETGANDVLVVQGERENLVPMIPGVLVEVDVTGGRIRVDWDPEF